MSKPANASPTLVDRASRNAEIRRLRDAGASISVITDRFDLKPDSVYKILGEHKDYAVSVSVEVFARIEAAAKARGVSIAGLVEQALRGIP